MFLLQIKYLNYCSSFDQGRGDAQYPLKSSEGSGFAVIHAYIPQDTFSYSIKYNPVYVICSKLAKQFSHYIL